MTGRLKSGMDRVLTIGELAKRSGVAVSALRFYESRHLIQSTRSAGNQRQYPQHMLRRVAIIRAAQRLGISLAEIETVMSTLPIDHAPSAKDWRTMTRQWKQDLTRRIDMLLRLRDDLDGCIGCGCLSLRDCPLRNPNDEAASAGPGARLFDP
jgi:MerR family transcriptional regulator, redox-sensitive transcriptional activator SoxR